MSGRVSYAPFFIVGCPRTGTTLLRRILNAHSEVAIPPESFFVYEYLNAEHVPLDKRKAMLCRDPAFESWGIRPTAADLQQCRSIAECLLACHEKYACAQGKSYWGHKTQTLIRHAEEIAAFFPQVRFIHVVRDARAVANSLKRSDAHRLNTLIAAERYNLDTDFGLRLERRYPERTNRVHYERLACEPEQVVGALCEWLGLTFETRMIESAADSLPLDAAEALSSHHRNINRHIAAEFSDKWRHELAPHEINLVTWLTRDTMKRAGYDIKEEVSPPNRLYLVGLRLQHLAVSLYKLIRNLWARPYLWPILRRKIHLATLTPAIRDLLMGR